MSNIFFGGNRLLDPHKILSRLDISQGMKIADLGSGGVAHFTFPASELVGESGEIFAVDILKGILHNIDSRAKEVGASNIHTIWSNIENYGSTGIADEYIDLVFLVNILFQSEKPFDMLREAARILKSGGKLLVVDWKKVNVPFGPPLEIRVREQEIKSLALALKLEELESFSAGKYHFGIIFKK